MFPTLSTTPNRSIETNFGVTGSNEFSPWEVEIKVYVILVLPRYGSPFESNNV